MRKRIRELRETAGLSQNRLGKLAGIQQASTNRYEHGQAVPSPKALLWYAEYFDVSLDYLFGRTDSPHGIRYPYKQDHIKTFLFQTNHDKISCALRKVMENFPLMEEIKATKAVLNELEKNETKTQPKCVAKDKRCLALSHEQMREALQ